jgi:DnaK suppressor protein
MAIKKKPAAKKPAAKPAKAKKPAKPAKAAKPPAKPVKPVKAAKPAPKAKAAPPAKAKPVAKPAVGKAAAKPVAKPAAVKKPPVAEKVSLKDRIKEKIHMKPKEKIDPSVVGDILPPKYDPRKDKGEFMNPVMLEYFRRKLIGWREELVRESSETIHNTLQNTELQKPDLADRASAETDHALELRTRDRERKLISKINEALLRVEDGTYGYCEETGEPIQVARLDARPVATLTIEAQERHERMERTHRDD